MVKIGGSLQSNPAVLKKFCRTLYLASQRHPLLVVPGGGSLADFVRKFQAEYRFSDRTAHLMAILSMEVYGFMLHDLIKGSVLTDALESPRAGARAIIMPYKTLQRSRELEASWEVTSDSIAAWVASKVGCKTLILVKMVDGIFQGRKFQKFITTGELKKMNQSVVDPRLAEILEKAGVTCFIVNGKYPSRFSRVLESKKVICTVISQERSG